MRILFKILSVKPICWPPFNIHPFPVFPIIFTVESRSYLVLEFIHGKDMEAIINETSGFLPESQVLTWAIELCDVLDYLHKHKPDPIIFRDMKPSNVMINHNGDVILVDFGIAKTFQSPGSRAR